MIAVVASGTALPGICLQLREAVLDEVDRQRRVAERVDLLLALAQQVLAPNAPSVYPLSVVMLCLVSVGRIM